MSADYEILAECRTYPQVVAALRARALNHIGSSFDKIELIADLPAGYLSKLTARKPNRGLGNLTLGPLLMVSGAMLLLVVDPTTIDAARKAAARRQVVLERSPFDPHKRNRDKVASGDMRPVKRPQNKGFRGNGDWSKQMNARRHLKMTDNERQASARKAARARWAKLRRELATSCA